MFEGLFRPGHLLIILAIVLLVFGPAKLPEFGSALGRTIRDFKKAMSEGAQDAPQAREPEKRLPEKAGA